MLPQMGVSAGHPDHLTVLGFGAASTKHRSSPWCSQDDRPYAKGLTYNSILGREGLHRCSATEKVKLWRWKPQERASILSLRLSVYGLGFPTNPKWLLSQAFEAQSLAVKRHCHDECFCTALHVIQTLSRDFMAGWPVQTMQQCCKA